ncbi:MAG: NAD-dependent epimerase/dehydratase family protein [Candidatus Zhuqueibacterota bacterium]
MNIFITGINGFIGSNLARILTEKGQAVSGSIRRMESSGQLKHLNLRLLCGDILDQEFLEASLQNQDIVYHIAALVSDWGHASQFLAINVEGSKNVARAALSNRVKRLVYISSTAVYGLSGFRDATEAKRYNCDGNHYAESKKLAESWLNEFCRQNSLPLTIIQPANVFGPHDLRFFFQFSQALETGFLPYIRQGVALTCPSYVENLAEALWLAGTHPHANRETFIVSDGLEINWRQFIEKICCHLDIKPPGRSVSNSFAQRLASVFELVYKIFKIPTAPPVTRYRIRNFGLDYHFSIAKIKTMLGYSPVISIDEAIQRTVLWYRQYLKEKSHVHQTGRSKI